MATGTSAAPADSAAPTPTTPSKRFAWLRHEQAWGWGVLALTLLTLLLRVHNLAAESLDIDEADVVVYATADLHTVLQRLLSAGDNGPGYMVLVRLWMAAAGQSEFALRFFSVLPGVATVPLLYALGRKLFDRRVGLAAAVLGAASTYLLFYAQMNKMYALVVALTLAVSYLLLRGIETGRWRYWLAYVAGTTLLMSTHIFGALVVPWHVLYALLALRRSRRHLLQLLLATAALTLPYVPLALRRLGALQQPDTLTREFTGPRDLPGMFAFLAHDYGLRFEGEGQAAGMPVFALATVAGLGLLAWRWPQARGWGLVFVALGLCTPLLAVAAMVSLGAPLFASRYLVMTLPFYYLAWAGVAAVSFGSRLWPIGLAVLLLFAAGNGQRWWPGAFEGARVKEDFRTAVATLQRQYQPGDLVVTIHDSVANGVRYYATTPLSILTLEGGPGRPPDRSKLTIEPSTGRIWLVAIHVEAEGLPELEHWLYDGRTLGSKRWLGGVMLAEFNRAEW